MYDENLDSEYFLWLDHNIFFFNSESKYFLENTIPPLLLKLNGRCLTITDKLIIIY